MNLAPSTLDECVADLVFLRQHKPYQYGGRWFVAVIDGEGYAMRDKRDLRRKAAKAGIDSFEYATIGSK